MGLFDSDWQRLHKKISRDYELIAIRYFEDGQSLERADVLRIIAEIVRKQLPNLSDIEAEVLVKNEYQNYRNLSVKNDIANALKNVNPEIPESGVTEIYETVKKRFQDSERWHEYFLFFIISKMIELNKLSISRGYYLLEISTGKIPRPSRIVRFFQLWGNVARYNRAKEKLKFDTETNDSKIIKKKKFLSSRKQTIRIQFGDEIDSDIVGILTEVIKDEFENEYNLKINSSNNYQELFQNANSGEVDILIINLSRMNFDAVDYKENHIEQDLKHIANLKIFGWQSIIVLSGYNLDKSEIDVLQDSANFYFGLPVELDRFKIAFGKCLKEGLDIRKSIKNA